MADKGIRRRDVSDRIGFGKCDRPTLNDLGGALLLHARAIRMPHPSGGELKVIAKLQGHIKTAFNTLGFDESDAKDPFAPFEGTR